MKHKLLALVALGGVAACSESMHPGVTAVSVSTLFPAPDAADVSRGDTIRLALDMPMDSADCATRFTLHLGDSSGMAVPGRILFGDGYRQMMFVPDSLLQSGTRYFAHMRDGMVMLPAIHGNGMGGMMDGGGTIVMTGQMPRGAVRMAGGMGWAFTTRS